MLLLRFVVDFLIILMLLRLLIRPNEAFFHPIYRMIYRITDPVLTPSRYITRTPTQGILLTTIGLVVLRGIIFMATDSGLEVLRRMGYFLMPPLPPMMGMAASFIELFRLLFQAYMVMWVIAVVSGRGYGTSLIHMMARAFLPIDAALGRLGIPRSWFTAGAFLFLWILHGLLVAATISLLILQTIPTPSLLAMSLGEGLKLVFQLFPGFFSILIIIGALLSWVSPDPHNPIVQTIYGISEPLLAPFRRLVPSLGGLDITPIFAILAFQLIGRFGLEVVHGLMKAIV
jgi:YggT family protein